LYQKVQTVAVRFLHFWVQPGSRFGSLIRSIIANDVSTLLCWKRSVVISVRLHFRNRANEVIGEGVALHHKTTVRPVRGQPSLQSFVKLIHHNLAITKQVREVS